MKEIPLSEISNSLEEAITQSDLKDVSIDLAELSIDNLLDDGIIKDIPFLRTLVGISQTASNIQNRLFLKKILAFLSEINQIPQKERELMIAKIDSSDEYKIKVGEKILYIVDKADDHQITRILGVLFSAFIKGKITYDEFTQSTTIINGVFIKDLINFVNENGHHSSLEKAGPLLNSGLYIIEIDPIEVDVEESDDHEDRNKYSTDVSGGELSAMVSEIGRKIRDVLKGKV